MRGSVRRYSPVILAAVLGSLLTADGPVIADMVYDANNAHKVDGRHAVPASTAISGRAGQLVATNARGRLPNDIIVQAPDAELLDGLDSRAFERTLQRTVVIRAGGSAVTRGARLRQALQAIAAQDPPPSAQNTWLVRLEAGIYDLGDVGLAMVPFVDIEGSGRDITTIRCACTGNNADESYTIAGADHAALRSLGVVSTGGAFHTIGIYTPSGADTTVTDVRVRVSGAEVNNALLVFESSPRFTDVDALANGGGADFGHNYGLYSQAGTPWIRDSVLVASGGFVVNTAVSNIFSGTVRIDGSSLRASGGSSPWAIDADSGTAVRVAATEVDGAVRRVGTVACVAAYNAVYAPLNETCD